MEQHAWQPRKRGAAAKAMSEGAHDAHDALDLKLRRQSAKIFVSGALAMPRAKAQAEVERPPAAPSRYPVTHLLQRSWARITRILAVRRERES